MEEKSVSLFIKITDEDLVKLLYYMKPRKKSEAFKNAFIKTIINDKDFAEKYINEMFKNEFEKILKKIKKKYNIETESLENNKKFQERKSKPEKNEDEEDGYEF